MFDGVIYFSNCPRCMQPWSTPLCVPPPHLQPLGVQMRHDSSQPGFPLHYRVETSTRTTGLSHCNLPR